ncbi:MAG TPA: site-specific DNA-methyltransferase [Gemmataceae bacterium]
MTKRWDYPDGSLYLGDCRKVMKSLSEHSVDLVFGSPPYQQARDYLEDGEDLGIARDTDEWVAWMVRVFKSSLRVSKGLVAFVVGHGKGARSWSAAPALLCADLYRAGINLRSPVWYKRVGSPGAGGDDWLRPDLEWIICAANDDKELPWSDNTACGHPPKYGRGGAMSRRLKDGRRVDGRPVELRRFVKANPGNVIDVGAVGGGRLGAHMAHENEAPFPERLPDFFIRSFCPPGGTVLDPFGGSGTTLACAIKRKRKFISIDLRESQVQLMRRRVKIARSDVGMGL